MKSDISENNFGAYIALSIVYIPVGLALPTAFSLPATPSRINHCFHYGLSQLGANGEFRLKMKGCFGESGAELT